MVPSGSISAASPGLELSQIGDFRWNENPPDSMNSSLVQTRTDACGANSKEGKLNSDEPSDRSTNLDPSGSTVVAPWFSSWTN